jgi:hypothetical protein
MTFLLISQRTCWIGKSRGRAPHPTRKAATSGRKSQIRIPPDLNSSVSEFRELFSKQEMRRSINREYILCLKPWENPYYHGRKYIHTHTSVYPRKLYTILFLTLMNIWYEHLVFIPIACFHLSHSSSGLLYTCFIWSSSKAGVHVTWLWATHIFFSSCTLIRELAPILEHRTDYTVPWAFTAAGLLGRAISSSQGLYLNTGQHEHRKTRTHIQHPCQGRHSNPQSRPPSDRRLFMPQISRFCIHYL